MDLNILVVDGSFALNTDGSDRKNNGRLTKLLRDALGAAEAEAELLEMIDLAELEVKTDFVYLHEVMPRVGFYTGDFESLPPAIIPTFEKMLWADAIIFGSPTAWYNMSGQMKVFIEHLTVFEYGPELLADAFPAFHLKKGRQLSGKLLGLISSCNEDGAQKVNESMSSPFSDMGMHLPKGCMFYQNGNIPEGASEDNWQRTYQHLVGENIVRMFCMMNGIKVTHNNWELREE